MDDDVPDGIELRQGRAPIVVYAPHGGRRLRPVRRGDSVNDLHTAEIAAELASRLDAHAVINRGVDRNRADLNRISVLTGDARGVLAALRSSILRCSRGGETPLVLLVHGWNVTLPACDVGIGLCERGDRLHGAHPTVSRATLRDFIRPLARELAACGIEAPLGRRYPAGARDNATQLFSGRHHEHSDADVAALSTLARAGKLDAVQLELAIPLRWPGVHREAFLDSLVAAARDHVAARRSGASRFEPRSEWELCSDAQAGDSVLPPGWSVQAVLADGSGLFAGAEPTGAREAAARLCIVRRDGRMLLFVGEGEWEGDANRHTIGGLELDATETSASRCRIRIRYQGPMISYASHDAFCDLEEGLAGARLARGDARLELEAGEGNIGVLRGYVRTDEGTLEVECAAVWERGSRRSGAARARSRVIVASESWSAGDGEVLEWHTDDDGEVREFAFALADGRAATGHVLTRVPVYRVLRGQIVVKVTFGTAAVAPARTREDSLALFERVEIVSSP